jgi:hypothetical protein
MWWILELVSRKAQRHKWKWDEIWIKSTGYLIALNPRELVRFDGCTMLTSGKLSVGHRRSFMASLPEVYSYFRILNASCHRSKQTRK